MLREGVLLARVRGRDAPFGFALSKIPASHKSGEKWSTPFSVASVGRRPMHNSGQAPATAAGTAALLALMPYNFA